MTLAIGWLHEAGDPPHPALRGGSMTLAIRWLHEGGETLGTRLHEAGDWHADRSEAPGRLEVVSLTATRHPHGATDRQDHGAGWVSPTTASRDAIGGA